MIFGLMISCIAFTMLIYMIYEHTVQQQRDKVRFKHMVEEFLDCYQLIADHSGEDMLRQFEDYEQFHEALKKIRIAVKKYKL